MEKLEQQKAKIKTEIFQVETENMKMDTDIQKMLRKNATLKTKLDDLDNRMKKYREKKGKCKHMNQCLFILPCMW